MSLDTCNPSHHGDPPAYRDRLVLEGWTLVGAGAIAALVVVLSVMPVLDALFYGQLIVGIPLLAVLGRRAASRGMQRAAPLAPHDVGSGEPTPLWHVVGVVAIITPLFWVVGGPLGGLSAGVGSALVGLAQALVLAPAVAREEARTGRRHLRMGGSRVLRGTKLGWLPDRSGNRTIPQP